MTTIAVFLVGTTIICTYLVIMMLEFKHVAAGLKTVSRPAASRLNPKFRSSIAGIPKGESVSKVGRPVEKEKRSALPRPSLFAIIVFGLVAHEYKACIDHEKKWPSREDIQFSSLEIDHVEDDMLF